MKLLISCSTCIQQLISEGVRLGSSEFEERQWVEFVDVNDQRFYSATCPEGHKVVCGLSNRNFELLFDRAACALVDGYHREAIATFASALERFFEFYVRVVARNAGIRDDVLAEFWRPLSSRSERQLGAIYFAYLMLNKRAFPHAEKKMEELRNNVVHKGHFATKAEAFAFGAHVYDTIWSLIEELQNDAKEALERESHASNLAEIRAGCDRIRYKGNVSGLGLVTIIQINSRKSKPFDDAITAFERHNPWLIGGYSLTLGRLAKRFGLTVQELLRELASGKYAAAFDVSESDTGPGREDVPSSDEQQARPDNAAASDNGEGRN